ncbi:hypothetical protein [Novosphingobium sp. Rr 2-17]|uniref:hypothetical protein n=1 Tax=Novosphingobium sp. Rr 2-17 TaxID=555793 RepID=UPI0002D2F70C|nr:hypothetical protein [Novosphingobium sp. Rr 2-17]
MTPLHFYQEQADQQTLAAEGATLQNVRDRCLRAAAAWSELAARARRTEDSRARAAADKMIRDDDVELH